MFWLLAAIVLIAVVVVVLLLLMKRGASRINDYFCNAVTVYSVTGDEPARVAALAAAKVAAGVQRDSMLVYLRGMASDMAKVPEGKIMQMRLLELADEIAAKDWDGQDIRAQKAILGEVDPEYLAALNKYDPEVFEKRWAQLFASDK